ncbi:DUF3006 domain-containing protein [Pisciglobus halotolerans]|uniref:DUF3006 domain-containing protein n=1 Tax=Pisciglobus halotolerans TaxID=745365 RepID=A0A1I3BL31_9LACT|nr:DUF3006 domain-containing protein [Pisciglobus halotolerans]SFH62953.1 Protein of unknown function [Pisciglobus halotolerans]
MKGVLDRFESQQKAVILIEEIQKEWVVPRSILPEGSSKNTWFTIEEQGDTFKIKGIDEKLTKEKAQSSAALLKKLRAKNTGSKFKRKSD